MTLVRRIVSIGALLIAVLALPALAVAQTEAVITGVVTDSSGGVLPGVTVTAVHVASGNTFTSVTDERGVFRMQARVGTYQVLMELQGFQSVKAEMTLLAGQTANIPVQMAPATLQENVTVTAEAPLVNVTQTDPSGNIDPKQFSELPAEGQNWMALLLVAPGSRTTSANQNSPIPMRGGGGDQQFFQTNVDGQQVSNELGGGRQPLMSQEMISELQFISNRFDATQGRSLGVQVNVITKSGTNKFAGSVRGNFRDSKIGYAKDPLANKVVPFKDQQFAAHLADRSSRTNCISSFTRPTTTTRARACGRPRIQSSTCRRTVCSPRSRAASGSTTRSRRRRASWRRATSGETGTTV